MATIREKTTNGYIAFPDTLPLVNISDSLYSAYGVGDKTYTATKPCIAFCMGPGGASYPTVITVNNTAYNLNGTIRYPTIFLNTGEKIKIPGYSSWSIGLFVYGIRYPEGA